MEPLRATDPRQVGSYRLTGRLGSGGMGEVFLGESPGHRKVAVKLLKSEHATDPGFRARFAREVEAAKLVGGFHTAQVVGADPEGDPPWLVTAYVPGPSLADAVKRSGPLDPEAVRLLGAALAEGLAAIHACGLVHRDLKPGNIIMADDGPRIIDFGVARTEGAEDLTASGMLVGTITYMSPEQVSGARVDARSDVFSLGAVLAYAATGRAPFDAPTMPAIATRIVNGQPDLEGIARPLRDTIEACLAKDPAARPGLDLLTGTALQDTYVPPSQTRTSERIAAPVPPPPVPPPPPWAPPSSPGRPRRRGRGATAALAAGTLAVAAGIGVGAYLLTNDHPAAKQPGASPATRAPATPGREAASTSPKATGTDTVPARYIGHWKGTLRNNTGLQGPTSAALTVTKGTNGQVVGSASYAAVGCTYELHLVSGAARKVTLHELVDSGPCVTEYVVLTPAPQGGLTDNVYDTLPSEGGAPTFTGHLSRSSS